MITVQAYEILFWIWAVGWLVLGLYLIFRKPGRRQ